LHGSVYFADEQRAGRGRGDHAWHSAAGEGLYVSGSQCNPRGHGARGRLALAERSANRSEENRGHPGGSSHRA
jgi:biotin-(acetyl-CoA carboxylase) ligase